jgi:hypothetical protein
LIIFNFGDSTRNISSRLSLIVIKNNILFFGLIIFESCIFEKLQGLSKILFSNDKINFSCCYAIIIFVKKDETYEKAYSSIKQVYTNSKQLQRDKKYMQDNEKSKKHYTQSAIEEYYLILRENFTPHIIEQYVGIIENKRPHRVFAKPKKPVHYYLPH